LTSAADRRRRPPTAGYSLAAASISLGLRRAHRPECRPAGSAPEPGNARAGATCGEINTIWA